MDKVARKQKRQLHIRKKVSGTAERPRLAVYKSNKHIYAQLINDSIAKTICAVADLKVESAGNIVSAIEVGKLIAEKAKALKITKVVFDRGGYRYHGQVKALAESARSNGLQF